MKTTSLLFCLTALSACASLEAQAPSGFAAFSPSEQFRSLSSDGVLYSVRRIDNEPYAELVFWQKALREHLLGAGYNLVAEKDLEVRGHKGALLELAAPVGPNDYAYLLALFVEGDTIFLVEAAGEVVTFEKRKAAVVGALEGLPFE